MRPRPRPTWVRRSRLVGTNFTSGTQVVFSTRDNEGRVGTVTVNPTAVKVDGTRLQVFVPDLAQTGAVTLVGGAGSVPCKLCRS